MPKLSDVQRSVRLAKQQTVGGDPVLQTVRQRAEASPIPSAFPFAVAILWQEGRIADPAAFQSGWRSNVGPEKSPWQIHPTWHDFAANTPADDFAAYTDYAFSLLEDGFFETGTLFGAARRYNSFNACEEGRGEGCRNGRQYASEVISVLPKIQTALRREGFDVGPDVTTAPLGEEPSVGGGLATGGGSTLGLIVLGLAGAGVAVYAASGGENVTQRSTIQGRGR